MAHEAVAGGAWEEAPCGLLTFGDDGTIVAANAALSEMLGYAAGELTGRPVETLLPVAGRIFFQTHLSPMLRLQGRLDEVFLLLRRRDGGDVGVLLNAERRDRGGAWATTCALLIVRERQRFEEELLLARRAAEEARDRTARQNRELERANEALEQQAVELELQQQQLQEQATELELATQQLTDNAAELEAQSEELHATAAQLEERTEEAEASRASAERERARLDRVLAQTPAAVAVYEGPELRVRAMSAAYQRIIGGREVRGLPIREALPELEGQGFFELLDRVYASGEPTGGTNVPARWDADGDGTPEEHLIDFTYSPLIDAEAQPEGVVALVLDVSDRARLELAERAARAAAEEAASRLASVLDSLPDAAAVYDVDWRYTFVNPAARALHAELFALGGGRAGASLDGSAGSEGGSVLGRVVWDVFPWLVGTKFELESRRAVAEGRTLEYVEYVEPLARWYETRIVPTAAGAVSLNRDVTAQRLAETERERMLAAERTARAAAEEANATKAQFLATMSHELRTPLNAIQGHVQLLELGIHGPVTEVQREALGRIGRAQRHLLGLIDDILSYARLESGRVEYDVRPVQVAEIVRDLLPMVEPQLHAKGLTLDLRLPEPGREALGLVLADREKLAQVLLNLLSNATKFTRPGGRVTVELSDRTDGPGPAGLVPLSVSDTGVGIPQDKLEAVFEPFVQLRSASSPGQSGTGLGLAISRDLTRGMGGDLHVRSTEGEGSCFTVVLRRVSPDPSEAPAAD